MLQKRIDVEIKSIAELEILYEKYIGSACASHKTIISEMNKYLVYYGLHVTKAVNRPWVYLKVKVCLSILLQGVSLGSDLIDLDYHVQDMSKEMYF